MKTPVIGTRVSVYLPKPSKDATGVVVTKPTRDSVLVILDHDLPRRRYTDAEASCAELYGVEPTRCKRAVVWHVQKKPEDAHPDSFFLCATCGCLVRRSEAVFLCQSHVSCWNHVIPEHPIPAMLQQIEKSLDICEISHNLQLPTREKKFRALLVYTQYLSANDADKEEWLHRVLVKKTLPCDWCSRTRPIGDIQRQFEKKWKDGESFFSKFWQSVEWILPRGSTTQENESSEAQSREIYKKYVDALCSMGYDRSTSQQIVEHVEQTHPASVQREEQFWAFCHQAMRDLQSTDRLATQPSQCVNKPNSHGRMSCRDALLNSPPPSTQTDGSPTTTHHLESSNPAVTYGTMTRSKAKRAQRRIHLMEMLTSMSINFETANRLLDDLANTAHDWETITDDNVIERCTAKLHAHDVAPPALAIESKDEDMQAILSASGPCIGAALVNNEDTQNPMEIDVDARDFNSHIGEKDLKRDHYPPQNDHAYIPPHASHRTELTTNQDITLPDLRISARHPRSNSKRVLKIAEPVNFTELRDHMLAKFQDELCDARDRDSNDYSLYIGDERHYNLEIIPSSIGEPTGTARFVTNIRKDDAIYLRRVNDNVGPKQSLAVLVDTFKFNQSIQQKILELQGQHSYGAWRRIRGDGNCYYRAVLFGYLEQLLTHDRREELLHRFSDMLETVQYPTDCELAREHHALLEEVRAAAARQMWQDVEGFESRILDPTHGTDLALMRAVRRIIGNYLLGHAQDDLNGISLSDAILLSYPVENLQEYVDRYVHKLGEDAEGVFVNMGIMFNALGIGGQTVVLDRRADVDLNYLSHHGHTDVPITVHLLLRPGHYDLLYTRD